MTKRIEVVVVGRKDSKRLIVRPWGTFGPDAWVDARSVKPAESGATCSYNAFAVGVSAARQSLIDQAGNAICRERLGRPMDDGERLVYQTMLRGGAFVGHAAEAAIAGI